VRKILIVDDQLDAAQLLGILLQLDGYQAEWLQGNWTGLVAEVEARRPDLVILDVRLPGASGLDLLEQLRSHPDPGVSKVSVLLTSALDHRYEGEKAGMDGFLLKPFSRQELLDVVEGIALKRESA